MKLFILALFASAATASQITTVTVLDPWTYSHAMSALGVTCTYSPACYPNSPDEGAVLAAAFLGIPLSDQPLQQFYILRVGDNFELVALLESFPDVGYQYTGNLFTQPEPAPLAPLSGPLFGLLGPLSAPLGPLSGPVDDPPSGPLPPLPGPLDDLKHIDDVNSPSTQPPEVPEPGTVVLVGLTLAALARFRRLLIT